MYIHTYTYTNNIFRDVLSISNVINIQKLPLHSPRSPIRKQHEPLQLRKTDREVPDRRAHYNDLKQE